MRQGNFFKFIIERLHLMFLVVENVRRQQLHWLNFILEAKGWDLAELARRTERDPSTYSKFLNDSTNSAQLSSKTVDRVARASGIPAYESELAVRARGLAEIESAPYEAEPLAVIDGAVKFLRGPGNGVDPWILRSRSLENAGYMPGDILMVDLNGRPEPGDVVCAQIYDRSDKAETIFRIYEHPFLISATLDGRLMKPHLVDNDRVVIRGVVIASLRERRAA
jgi:transcriptional regulator with XRE-family HTH domain